MTGVNVAIRMAGDSFVAAQIDNPLTAWPSEIVAGIARTVFTTGLLAMGRQKP